MTKEELKQEAEDNKPPYAFCTLDTNCELWKDGYQKGAEQRERRIADLEAQIEKMKNWCNCKNYQQCLIELAEQGKGMKPSECCVNCKKWEIKEK